MSEKLDKLRATLKKEQERRIKLNNRIAVLERRIQEEEAAEVQQHGTHGQCDPGTACRSAATVGQHYPEPGCTGSGGSFV